MPLAIPDIAPVWSIYNYPEDPINFAEVRRSSRLSKKRRQRYFKVGAKTRTRSANNLGSNPQEISPERVISSALSRQHKRTLEGPTHATVVFCLFRQCCSIRQVTSFKK